DDIEYQRNITRAEKDSLEPVFSRFDLSELCSEVVEFLKKDERFYEITIEPLRLMDLLAFVEIQSLEQTDDTGRQQKVRQQ
ncbi:MAG: hypothetical protein HGA25_08425, partial [Clostridiales bacterium]|nr:hypothetical protein [Clostridiales bacterium]